MQIIRQLTSIPVPEIVRVHAKGRRAYIFMSYIPGSTLQDLWPTLSDGSKTKYSRPAEDLYGRITLCPISFTLLFWVSSKRTPALIGDS